MANINTSLNIVSVAAENVNASYNERTCVDGGGYWQPCGTVLMELEDGALVSVECDNTSCGDFGYRKYYEITADGFKWRWHESNMDDAADTSLEEINEILDSIESILNVDAVGLLDVAIDAIHTVAHHNWF